MNYQQVSILSRLIHKYLNANYKLFKLNSLSDEDYLQLFDKTCKDVKDLSKTMFILPNGKLKRFELNLDDFLNDNDYANKFGITKENIYEHINLEHNWIEYVGFDLDRLFNMGCIRIANNIINNEISLDIPISKNINKKMLKDLFDWCLINYKDITIYFFDSKDTDKNKRKDFIYCNEITTSKDILRDLNEMIKKINNDL